MSCSMPARRARDRRRLARARAASGSFRRLAALGPGPLPRPAATIRSGVRATTSEGTAWSETVAPVVRENPAIAAAWARGQVRRLEDRYAAGLGDRPALERSIIATSLRFGVLCRFTAYVAIDRAAVVNEGGEAHQITQPVEMPAGWCKSAARSSVARVRCGMLAVQGRSPSGRFSCTYHVWAEHLARTVPSEMVDDFSEPLAASAAPARLRRESCGDRGAVGSQLPTSSRPQAAQGTAVPPPPIQAPST